MTKVPTISITLGRFPVAVLFHFMSLWLAISSIDAVAFAATELDSTKALRSIKGNWWNHDNNSYIAPTIDSAPPHDNLLRKNGRLEQIVTNQPNRWNWNWGNFQWLGSILGYILIGVLIALVTAGLIWLILHAARSIRPFGESDYLAAEVKIDPTKIEELPFEAISWMGDPLAEARKLAQQGRFDEAIVYLYGYQLLALDQVRKVHLHKGKTNRMYLREIDHDVRLKEIVALTMEKFEEVYFGKRSLTKNSFLEVWSQLDAFHALAAQASQPDSSSRVTTVGVAS